MTPASTNKATRPHSLRAPNWLRTTAQVLRLIGMAPGLMFGMVLAYRAFERHFVDAATQLGMPRQEAREAARQLRPREALGFARRHQPKAGSSSHKK